MKVLMTSVKSKAFALVSIILAFFIPIYGLLLAVGLAIVADTITGVYKAKRLKQKITSRRLSEIVSKMFLYQGVVVLFFFIDRFILGEFTQMFIQIPLFLTKVVSALLCFIEVKSIDENFEAITGQSLWSKLKDILARTKELKHEFEELKPQNENNK
jgi:hypothetical protein